MAVELDALRDPGAASGPLVVEEVSHAEALEDWARIVVSVFGFPSYALEPWRAMYAAVGYGRPDPWRHYVGRLGGDVVTTSSLHLGAGVAGTATSLFDPEG